MNRPDVHLALQFTRRRLLYDRIRSTAAIPTIALPRVLKTATGLLAKELYRQGTVAPVLIAKQKLSTVCALWMNALPNDETTSHALRRLLRRENYKGAYPTKVSMTLLDETNNYYFKGHVGERSSLVSPADDILSECLSNKGGGRGLDSQRRLLKSRQIEQYLIEVEDIAAYKYYEALAWSKYHCPETLPLWKDLLRPIVLFRRPDLVKCMLYSGTLAFHIEMEEDCGNVKLADLDLDESHAAVYERVRGEIRRCYRQHLSFTTLIASVMDTVCCHDSPMQRQDELQSSPEQVLEKDDNVFNVVQWSFLCNNMAAIDKLMPHFLLACKGLHQNTLRDIARRLLSALPLAYPKTVDEILRTVKRILPDDYDFDTVINEISSTYGYSHGVIDRRQGYLILSASVAGNQYAVKELVNHGADGSLVEPFVQDGILELTEPIETERGNM